MKREKDFNDEKKRISLYFKEHTFVYIKEILPRNRANFYNGFITNYSSQDYFLTFFDVVLKKQFPITLNSIAVIEPSKKKLSSSEAVEIYKQVKGGETRQDGDTRS